MKSMRPPSAAIFLMTYFYRARGGHGPLTFSPPPDPLLFKIIFEPFVLLKITELNTRMLKRLKKIKYAPKDSLKGTKNEFAHFRLDTSSSAGITSLILRL